ncbi:MAG: L-serine ammonia-lyase [Lachnospiraceae bacterium]|nr:L-serine ammonia-lyase [Lachnospiraceae bacterium]
MKSIRSVYKVGNGPSSSHTVGPYNAARLIRSRFPEADGCEVTLYGSLACTGEGHATKKAITAVLPKARVFFDKETPEDDLPHPNTMTFRVLKGAQRLADLRIFSVGGGSIRIEGEPSEEEVEVYPQHSFTEMLKTCGKEGLTLAEFVYRQEGEGFRDYLREIWAQMQKTVESGLSKEGVLPGGLNVSRKAKTLFEKRCHDEGADVTMSRVISAYAYAAAEENAAEEVVVTAPTCGSCGVIPAVFYYMQKDRGFSEEEIVDALAVAGLIGNVIRTNASISGAECGCQAEIGSASAMAAAGLSTLYGMDMAQVEYAAEIAIEHNLGLTCDPVCGLVQIPCIERNAVAAMRAISCVNLARFLTETRKISFDTVLETMYRTGRDMNEKYRETSHGGLAVMYGAGNGE